MARSTSTTWLSVTLAGAAGIHAVVASAHAGADTVHATFFVFLAALQLALAVALVVAPRRSLLGASAVLNTATVVLWVLSRTVGLPGLSPERLAGVDLVTAGLEITAVALGLRLLAGSRLGAGDSTRLHPVRSSRLSLALAGTLAMAMVGASALGASAGHDHHQGAGPDMGRAGHSHVAGHLDVGGHLNVAGHPGHAGAS